MRPRTILGCLLASAILAFGAAAESSWAATAQLPVRPCASLTALDLSSVDAQISSAADQTQGGVLFCQVQGYTSPNTLFTVLLPEKTWLGNYLQQGCGGYCGQSTVNLNDPSRTSLHQTPYEPLLRGEFVVAADDQGHLGPGTIWGKEDLILRIVYGYRSEHDLFRAVIPIIRAYYGVDPTHKYFDGVSDGGHEALMVAQRYPTDFDGILVGSPANNWTEFAGIYQAWLIRANMDSSGHEILDSSKLPALHAAVMAACADANGVIRDPRACTFDPASIECPAGVDRSDCLTAQQVAVVRRLYRGPTYRGWQLYDGGQPYGSELAWAGWLIQPADDPAWPQDTSAYSLSMGYYRYLGFWRNPPASFSLRDLSFTPALFHRLQPLAGLYDSTDPDLRAFRAHGGKIIIYHGWADQGLSPWATINYYRAVARLMGGYDAIQSFSRFYMIPGLYHCPSPCGPVPTGDPAVSVNLFEYLVRWVEQGQAPDEATLPVSGQTTGHPITSLTVKPFDPVALSPRNDGLNSNYHYLFRRDVYRPGRELWCEQRERTLVCTRASR
ncbi:MAG: tannase/feruloyl esterase family alpha/beta hydrolase [Solirubrobacterales bacterium]|nr:tannase/feruloyl esterase family alpha/beta hydrolase [Solirubrobacterales bacterium]